jgi:carboxylesterase type B
MDETAVSVRDPSTPTLPWQAYEVVSPKTMILGERCKIVGDPRSAQRKLVAELFE